MANSKHRASIAGRAHGSRPLAFTIDVKGAALSIASFHLSLISRLTGAFRTWRQRTRDREELARMSHYELHDIRVSPSDRRAEIRKPFWRE